MMITQGPAVTPETMETVQLVHLLDTILGIASR